VVAPSIHGRVVHAHSGAAIDMAGVVVENYKEASVLTSRDGSFTTDQITRSKPYWVWWPFASDPVKEVHFRVVRPGFGKHKEKVAWHPKTESSVSLAQPIALEPKSTSDAAQELLDRVAR
jgi:hypothetical protein